MDNGQQDAKIYVCAHGVFGPQVKSPVYEVIDASEMGDERYSQFLSEFFIYQKLARKKVLPKVIGTSGYRKYFKWLDNVPTLTEDMKMVSKRLDLGEPMREQYKKFSWTADIDLMTDIINFKYCENDGEIKKGSFAEAWAKALEIRYLHPCSMFVMPSKDFRSMMKFITPLLDEWLKKATGLKSTKNHEALMNAIEKRILEHPQEYHLERVGMRYASRIGGQLGERLVSAWIDWQMPEAKEVEILVTGRRL